VSWLLAFVLASGPATAAPEVAAAATPAATEPAATQATFDYGRYVPSTLAHAEANSCAEERPATTIDVTLAPVRLDVIATRRLRPLAEDAAHVIALRERMTRQELPAYEQEVLVRIDGQERWLPIQPQLVPHWIDEVAEAQPVTLYAVRVGCHRAGSAAADRVVFSINEFEIAPAGPTEILP
jgi:hypothetical protein